MSDPLFSHTYTVTEVRSADPPGFGRPVAEAVEAVLGDGAFTVKFETEAGTFRVGDRLTVTITPDEPAVSRRKRRQAEAVPS